VKRAIAFRVRESSGDVVPWQSEEADSDQPAIWIRDGERERATFTFSTDGSIDARRDSGGKLVYSAKGDVHPEIPFKYEYRPNQGILVVYYGSQLRSTMNLWEPILPPGVLPDTISGGLRMIVRMSLKELSIQERRCAIIEFCPGCMVYQGDKSPEEWCVCWEKEPAVSIPED
jgi:hypothetical protein